MVARNLKVFKNTFGKLYENICTYSTVYKHLNHYAKADPAPAHRARAPLFEKL